MKEKQKEEQKDLSPERQNPAWRNVAQATDVAMAGMKTQRACFWPSKFARATNAAMAGISYLRDKAVWNK